MWLVHGAFDAALHRRTHIFSLSSLSAALSADVRAERCSARWSGMHVARKPSAS